MTLEHWLANGWLVPHQASHRETDDLLDAARNDLIAALPLLLGPEATDLSDYLDRCRARRHDVTYEALSAVSESEAIELIEAVMELDHLVRSWLQTRQARPR